MRSGGSGTGRPAMFRSERSTPGRDRHLATRLAVRPLAALAVLASSGAATGSASASATPAPAAPAAVDVGVLVGYGGPIPSARRLPARIRLTAQRSRRVVVGIRIDQSPSELRYVTDTVAGETVDLDVVIPGSASSVEAVARDGTVVGRGAARSLDRSSGIFIAATAPSLHTGRTAQIDLLGGTATAQLTDISLRDLDRPAFLDGISQLVLGPADADALTPSQRRAIGHWVAKGNLLSLDMAPADPIPGLDIARADAGTAFGARSAVGAGWVVFTNGAASARRWEEVLEPPQVDPLTAGEAVKGFGAFGGFGGPDIAMNLMNFALIRSSFPSGWLIAGIAFGSILLVGPVMWLVLRTSRRRVLMWAAAPAAAILIGGLTAASGGSQLQSRSTREVTAAELDAWGWSGDAAAATIRGTDVPAPPGSSLVSATPGIDAVDRGGELTLAPTRGDEYGAIAMAGVGGDRPLGIDVRADLAGNEVTVTVRNRTEGRLGQVQVAGWGLTDSVPDVLPGTTRTATFAIDRPRGAFGPSINVNCTSALCGMSPAFGNGETRNSTGVVRVSGLMRSSATSLGGTENLVEWGTTVPVHPADQETGTQRAALRVDALGPVVVTQVDPTGTVIEGQDDAGGTIRLLSPTDRPAEACGVHTAFSGLSRWDGTSWVPLEAVGEQYESRRFGSNAFQRYQLPEIRAGVPLLVRVDQTLDPNGATLAIDCDVEP